MVMATGTCRRASAASSPPERMDIESDPATSLHERYVAYVHALDNAHDARTGVWVEHSYARARGGVAGGVAAGGGALRMLLAPRLPAEDPDDDVDIERPDPPPPSPPTSPTDLSDSDSELEVESMDAADEWEERLVGLAPGGEHVKLARGALESLRRVRLARLSGGREAGRMAAREEARWLRLALAPLWARPPAPAAAAQHRPPAWLHAAITSLAPLSARRTYEKIVNELRRMAPRVAERLAGVKATGQRLEPVMPAVGAEAGSWLVWVGGDGWGGAGRWVDLLAGLVHTRVLRLAAPSGEPEAWCAAIVAAARATFADILMEAGDRSVVVGGCGAGATLAAILAGVGAGGSGNAAGGATGAGNIAVKGALLLGPPLLTAEGPCEWWGSWCRKPTLVVVGSCAATACRWSASAGAVGAAGAGDGAAGRGRGRGRVLQVCGADDRLRVSAAVKRRRRLTQQALDHAIAEECARWVLETCEAPLEEDSPIGTDSEEEKWVSVGAGGNNRAIEIAEGRVVSRVSGGTPLALMPPRRSTAPSDLREFRPERAERIERAERAEPTAALAAADIINMPIVFADDDAKIVTDTDTSLTESPVTVRSGEPRGGLAATGAVVGRGGLAVTGAVVGRGGLASTGAIMGRGAIAAVPNVGRGEGSKARVVASGGAGLNYTRVIVAKRGVGSGRARPLLLRRGLRLVPRAPRD